MIKYLVIYFSNLVDWIYYDANITDGYSDSEDARECKYIVLPMLFYVLSNVISH